MDFIVHKSTFPLLDAVLVRVNDVLTFKGHAIMKWEKKHTLVAAMRSTFKVSRNFVRR